MNPLHGRFTSLAVGALSFDELRPFFPGAAPLELLERFSVSGGMPRYVSELAGSTLRDRIVTRVLDRNGPLWDEPRSVLATELRQPATYFSILEQLASGGKVVDEVARRTRLENGVVSRYLGGWCETGLCGSASQIRRSQGRRTTQ